MLLGLYLLFFRVRAVHFWRPKKMVHAFKNRVPSRVRLTVSLLVLIFLFRGVFNFLFRAVFNLFRAVFNFFIPCGV